MRVIRAIRAISGLVWTVIRYYLVLPYYFVLPLQRHRRRLTSRSIFFPHPFHRLLTEYHFQQRKVDAAAFVCFLCGDKAEDSLSYWQEAAQVPLPLLYVLVRALKPVIVVETGVEAGNSSVSILQALKHNGGGTLYSIELGQVERFEEGSPCSLPWDKIGYLVPAELKDYWHLIRGDARYELPRLLTTLGKIDLFLHDSLHTDEHMKFEYETAWPCLKEDGCLLSDDIGNAFVSFANKVGKPYVCNEPQPGAQKMGGIRK